MNKNEFLSLLHVFKDARKKLLSDFFEENPDIFIPIFKYEDDENMLKVSIEYYLLEWINFHFKLFSEKYNTASSQYLLFIKNMSSLLSCFIEKEKVAKINDSEFIYELMREKRKILNSIFEVGDRAEINYRKLLHSSSKDKALFNRTFNSLQGVK